jgi:hypothetical protein
MNKATLYYFGATAALVSVSLYAPSAYPLVSKALTSELSLIRSATLNANQLNFIRNFGANIGLQYVFNGRKADYWDAATNTVNPFLALGTNSVIDFAPGNDDIMPAVSKTTPYNMAINFGLSSALTVLAQSFTQLNPALGPSFDYFMNVLESIVQDAAQLPDQSK